MILPNVHDLGHNSLWNYWQFPHTLTQGFNYSVSNTRSLLQTLWSMTSLTHHGHQPQIHPVWLRSTDKPIGMWFTNNSRAGTADNTKASYVQLAAEAIFTKVFTCSTHIEDGYLPKVGASFECGKHRSAIVSHYL